MPKGFWLQLISEWGADGDQPGQQVLLSLERLLAHMSWLRPACTRYGVGIRWQPELRALLEQTRAQRRLLDQSLTAPEPLDAAAVADRLTGGRFNRDLRTFQIRDLGHLLSLPNGANFSVPGAGKTTVAYAVYDAERTAGRVEQMLVVAPLSAFEAWMGEVAECFPDGAQPVVAPYVDDVPDDAEVLVVNYHRLGGHYEDLARWVAKRPTLVLLDEAHRMKRGWNGTFGSACLSIAFLAARRDILTGTPAPQSPQDLVALLDYLWPGQARRVLPSAALVNPPPVDAGHQVAAAIAPLFVRTRKGELQLEPPQLRVIQVEPDDLQREIYQALRDRYAGLMQVSMTDRMNFARMGDIFMYLLEAATNPQLLTAGSGADDESEFRHPPLEVPPGSKLWDLLQQYNQYETPAKFTHLAQMVADNAAAGRKTLVWTNFVRNLQTLERMLALHEPALIYGGIPPAMSDPTAPRTRESELYRFRNDPSCTVLLANPAAMSEGVSLHHDCHDAIYLDRTFNAGQYLQSIDRIHRLGLPPGQSTRISFLVSNGTIDEVVDDRIKEKAARLGEMLDDPDIATMALPSDEDYGPAIDTHDDLVALFAHLRGEE
ncbi:DEAD/DEAH box helicase [Blastococcus aggregatus]|uniref:DEAD/DEAH box helicase n=1 Tax=Blastococcus aggregatus TaxID=38502 RepID=UPI001142C29C|nr:DEAD/DEAH box helicase [Blastococcus aggregatus]